MFPKQLTDLEQVQQEYESNKSQILDFDQCLKQLDEKIKLRKCVNQKKFEKLQAQIDLVKVINQELEDKIDQERGKIGFKHCGYHMNSNKCNDR